MGLTAARLSPPEQLQPVGQAGAQQDGRPCGAHVGPHGAREPVREPAREPVRDITRRIALATLFTLALLLLAYLGMFVSTAPAPISLLLQPFSLLWMPGLLVALAVAGPHDFSPHLVVIVSFAFYLAFFYYVLRWRRQARTRKPRHRS